MTLPCIGRERAALSVTDGCRWRGGDGTSMLFRVPESVVNIAHFQKLNGVGHCLLIERFCGSARLWPVPGGLEFLDEYQQSTLVSQVDPNLVFPLVPAYRFRPPGATPGG